MSKISILFKTRFSYILALRLTTLWYLQQCIRSNIRIWIVGLWSNCFVLSWAFQNPIKMDVTMPRPHSFLNMDWTGGVVTGNRGRRMKWLGIDFVVQFWVIFWMIWYIWKQLHLLWNFNRRYLGCLRLEVFWKVGPFVK